MTHRLVMLVVLLATIVSTPARASLEIAPGLVAGLRPGTSGFGGAGVLAVAWKFDTLAFELRGESGYFAKPDDALAGIGLGVQWSPRALRLGPLSPFFALDLVHQHEIGWSDYLASPGLATAGVCSCIHHRTGAALAVGASWRITKALPLDVIGRVDGTALLPADGQPTAYLATSLALGWTF